jgi:hypothetical protein
MIKLFAWAGAALLVWAAPAVAQSACREPIVPPSIDGATATEVQMKTQGDDVRTFLRDSDVYQECLIKLLDDAAKKAKDDNTDVDARLQASIQTKIQSNQLLKERVGALYNGAVGLYHKTHPNN